jgi:hypothetical protein
LAYNEEYRTRIVGVWKIAAGLYLERGDVASKIQAGWYVENIKRLQSTEAIDAHAAQHQELLAYRYLRGSKRLSAARGHEKNDAPKPSIRQQLAEGKERLDSARTTAPQKTVTKTHDMEV